MNTSKTPKRELTAKQHQQLITTLKKRFEQNTHRHKDISWKDVEGRLKTRAEKCWSLYQMEQTGGEPDVIGMDKKSGGYIFVDCSKESPEERRSVSYDRDGQLSRKEHQPKNNAVDMATTMGVKILNQEEYLQLQKLDEFDLKTSSWIDTPPEIRKLGGALFADRRYDTVFVYHNGAQSYYSGRGFRGMIQI